MILRLVSKFVLAASLFIGGFASADVLIKAEKHPSGRLLSTNFTVYNDSELMWKINSQTGSLFFGAGTQLALPWNSPYRFERSTIISYDQRKLYEVEAGTWLTTPDYVPEVVVSEPPREPADEVHCVRLQNHGREVHCLVETDKEDDSRPSSGAYTSVNVSVSGNGTASGTAIVEGCKAMASSRAEVIGSGSASVSSVARAWGCSKD